MSKKSSNEICPERFPITQQEWFSPDNCLCLVQAAEKLPISRTRRGRRKLRLFSCACCRRIWHLIEHPILRDLIELAEQVADGDANLKELVRTYRIVQCEPELRTGLNGLILQAIRSVTDTIAKYGARHVSQYVEIVLSLSLFGGDAPIEKLESQSDIEDRIHCEILRDIFGNPFRPVTLDPRWLSSTVRDLARTIYEDRNFRSLPILSDALMDAGCDSEEIINHCRGPGPHVRGCWVVDMIIGKR